MWTWSYCLCLGTPPLWPKPQATTFPPAPLCSQDCRTPHWLLGPSVINGLPCVSRSPKEAAHRYTCSHLSLHRGPMPGIPGAGPEKSSPNPKFICSLCANRNPALWYLGRMSSLSNFCMFLRPHIVVTSNYLVSIPTGFLCQLPLASCSICYTVSF